MNPMILNALVGGATGLCAAFIGFAGNSRNQTFELQKAIPTLITGVIAGGIAGILAPDYKWAINAALGGEVLRKATNNFIVQGTPTITPPAPTPPK